MQKWTSAIFLLLILTGCSSQTNEENTLYCELDEECTHQQALCNTCECPTATNIYNKRNVECASPILACDRQCWETKPVCSNNTCVLVRTN